MNSWSTRRQVIYGGIVIIIIASLAGLFYSKFFYKAPECTDKIQNGDETGIDCGGSCSILCTSDTLAPIVLWSKVFKISGNVYSAGAYVENPNITSKNKKAGYSFKVYDENNILLATREGETFIPKNKKFLVLEPGILIENHIPKRVEFEFTNFASWEKDTSLEPVFNITYSELLSTSTSPHIEGTITNISQEKIPNVELSTIVLDSKDNAVAISRTFVTNILKNSSQNFVFTWPKPFNLGVEACSAPVDIALLLDRSGSMRSESVSPPEPFNTVKSTAQDFIDAIGGNDSVSIISFGDTARSEISLSLQKKEVKTALQNFLLSSTSEQTNITDGLMLAQRELTSEGGRSDSKKVIILLTDGVPTVPVQNGQADYPKISATALGATLKNSGITLYTIGLGKDISSGFLQTLAGDSGHYFQAPTKETLGGVYKKISTSLCARKPNVINVLYRLPE